MLSLQQVTKHYIHRGKTVKALDDVTVDISKGDFVSIVGPSGSGKSTLLLMLGGMLSPTSGKIILGGESLYDINPEERASFRKDKIGFLFQTFNLVPYLTAIDNVKIPLFLAGHTDSEQETKAVELLSRVGLADRLDHKPSELSGGQQQRVALARMLANDPAMVLADEPTGNLDPDTTDSILNFLEEINREGKTVLMVTHDPNASKRAKRVLRLADGKLVQNMQSVS
ncbi:MAG: ABC transporter ATP-binding protein [Candidatus Riflebacteria bacterium]|nr:ABC transporter ATP-binding protein [Candidatus Riflebacteria bacterium]